jgi:HD-GYP domain-containing protein (c-di-GMP phosphodiesterase class II)
MMICSKLTFENYKSIILPNDGRGDLLLSRVKSQVDFIMNSDFRALDCEAERLDHIVVNRLDAVAYSKETLEHIQRVTRCAAEIGKAMEIQSSWVQLLYKAAAYHDVGKTDVPDAILNKPGPLTQHERKLMQIHTIKGWQYLYPTESPIFKAGAIIARQHHERFDGSGYPDGLKGSQIHLFGRIVAVADVYDALSTERPYKNAWPQEAVLSHFNEESGILYDPKVVNALVYVNDRMYKVNK